MRLEEWQKWLDSQFLDGGDEAAQEAQATEAGAKPAAKPPAQMPPAVQARPPAPVQAAPSVAAAPPAKALAAEPTRAPKRPAPPVDEMDVPSIESYLPFLRKPQPVEPAPGPVEPEGPETPEEAAAVEEPVLAEPEVAAVPEPAAIQPVAEMAHAAEATAAPREPVTETIDAERDEPLDRAAMAVPAVASGAAAEAPRRFGISHRRARHVRNVRPDDVCPELDASTLWGLVPRHIQTLMALGDDEVARSSYKREFKESRVELIRRLLDPTLSLEDTARLLNVCPTTVRRYTNRGLLAHQRTPGDQRRFKLSDVLAFLEAQSQARK